MEKQLLSSASSNSKHRIDSSNQSKPEQQPVDIAKMLPLDIKWIALIALVFQNSGLAIAMRYSFLIPAEFRYLTSTAVLIAEVMKLAISLIACYFLDGGSSWASFRRMMVSELTSNVQDWFKLMVPSVLYTLQNSLQYYSMSCLSAPVFQVLYQMKIITTAMFSVILLSRHISSAQWLSVVALACGVALVQLSQATHTNDGKTNSIAGLVSVMCGCLTSGFAGVYFEMVLKSSKVSLWIRNIQLSSIGIAMAAISCFFRDYSHIRERGFFSGYNESVWVVIILQAAGGLLVALVVKYADNVLKGFATSLSILISCMVSMYAFNDIQVNMGFIVGAGVVLSAVYIYGSAPYRPAAAHVLVSDSANSPPRSGKSHTGGASSDTNKTITA